MGMNKNDNNTWAFQYRFDTVSFNQPHQLFENFPTSTRTKNTNVNNNYYSIPQNLTYPMNNQNIKMNQVQNVDRIVPLNNSNVKTKFISNYQHLPCNSVKTVNTQNNNYNRIMPQSTRMN